MIKAVIFDIGDVMINENAVEARKKICEKYGISEEQFKDFAMNNLSNSHRGTLKGLEFFRKLGEETGKTFDLQAITQDWIKAREETTITNLDMIELVKKLKQRYITGCLTNSTRLNDSASFRKKVYELFLPKIISYEVGLVKPAKDIYVYLLRKLEEDSVKPEEVIFIDDKEASLVPANELGMKTILFKDKEDLVSKLKELGVEL